MKLDVIKLDASPAGSIDLDDAVFGLEPRRDILHRMVRWQLAKRQAGTHATLGKSDVSYSTKKIYRQKGTGGARHGSRKAPIFRKGGTYKGPVPRSHAHDLTKKFRALGLRDFIVDLRYNGGGLLATAELVNNLLGGARSSQDVQMRTVHNTRKTSENDAIRFRPGTQSVQPVRIAFLTTGATASASEINVNSMAPWIEVAIVGENTLGKPVGQYAFDLSGCDDRLRLVTFKTVNSLGAGDYYEGLAGSVPFACAAEDTLAAPLGSEAEGMVAAALGWLRTGACPAVMPVATARSKTARADEAERYPLPRQPAPAQWWLPGIN